MYQDIRSLHLEPTSYCNARCPMCGRNIHGGKTNPLLYLKELSAIDVQKFFPPNFLLGLDEIFICGSYGEPILAKEILPITEYLVAHMSPRARIYFETNGSLHTPDWWAKFAGYLPRDKSLVAFGLDGLEDTHSVYRRGTDFNKILENAKAFISAGGSARWSFLVFKHNEHQVEAAKVLSEKLGFKFFLAKKTGRFFSAKNGSSMSEYPVMDAKGNVEYFLYPPESVRFQNHAINELPQLASEFGNFDRYLDETPIDCESLRKKRIYVAANGVLLPCGYLNHQLFDRPDTYGQEQIQFSQLVDVAKLNLHLNSIEAILANQPFQELMESWQKKSVAEGRIRSCALFCGKKFDRVGAQISGEYGI